MKILVTGASGFVGKHLVPTLLHKQHDLVLTARSDGAISQLPWYPSVVFVNHDLAEDPAGLSRKCGPFDCLIHLAWPGLPNYKDAFHLETVLPAQYAFIKDMVESGTKRVVITGTCFEYGMQEGCLPEKCETFPDNPYGQAKDSLRKQLELLQQSIGFSLLWLRLFYMYGPGQNPKSLLAQLQAAIENKEAVFNVSGGEQLRDYLPVEEVASIISTLSTHKECSGIYNCCRGEPVSIKDLLEQKLAEKGTDIKLNLGYYDYPDYEPMAFWGDSSKLENALNNLTKKAGVN